MLNILHNYNFDNLVRTDKKVKVTDPATVIKSGMVCRLDSNGEVVLAGDNEPVAVTGASAQPFAPVTGTSDKLKIKVDGGSEQTITLAVTDTTAALVVTKINATLTGATASATADNKVKIASATASGSIEFVVVANDAYTVLGFTVGKTVSTYKNVVYWAFTSANDTNENRGDFKITGKVTLLQGVFPAETDQYDVNASYSVNTKLAVNNGIHVPAVAGDYICARVTSPPVGGKLQILTAARPSVA